MRRGKYKYEIPPLTPEMKAQNFEIGAAATKAWERKIDDLVAQSQYKAVVEEHQRLISRGRAAADARAPELLSPKELEQLDEVDREIYDKRWASYKLCLVRPSWETIFSIAKVHVLLGNLSSACDLFSRSLPRYFSALKSQQLVAYSREFLLLLISQQSDLQEAPYFVSMLAHLYNVLNHGSIPKMSVLQLFQRPIDAALASKDLGTASRLLQELDRYSLTIPVKNLVEYTTERSKALQSPDLTEAERTAIAYDLSVILTLSLSSENSKTAIDLALEHLPPSMTLEFRAKKALFFPDAPTAQGDAFQDFEALSKLVWHDAPKLSGSDVNVPSPKL